MNKNLTMVALKNCELDLDVFYKKEDLPTISLGDKVKVVWSEKETENTVYLEKHLE